MASSSEVVCMFNTLLIPLDLLSRHIVRLWIVYSRHLCQKFVLNFLHGNLTNGSIVRMEPCGARYSSFNEAPAATTLLPSSITSDPVWGRQWAFGISLRDIVVISTIGTPIAGYTWADNTCSWIRAALRQLILLTDSPHSSPSSVPLTCFALRS